MGWQEWLEGLVLSVAEWLEFQEPWMQLAGSGPDPTQLGFVLAGLEGMKQLQVLDRLHGGEGSAWES